MPYKWQALAAVCFGTYMATMDFSIVNVALPTLSQEFSSPPDTVVWASLISGLVITGLTLTAGRVGDLFGRKRIYITGWFVFTIGMGLASFAHSIEQLIAIRFVQSVGVAMAVATGNAIVTHAFPDNERGRALGTTSAVVGAGLMSGPILGGVVLGAMDWRAIFYLRVPIGLVAMTLAFLFIRESEAAEERHLDVGGALALFLTLSAALLAVNRGQEWGWASPSIIGLFAFAVASCTALLAIERKAAGPVISLALFRVRSFAVSVASLALNFGGQSAVTFLMPFYLITVRGESTERAGLVLATVPAMMVLLSPASGYLSDRFGFRHQVTLGVAVVSVGLLLLTGLDAQTSTASVVLRLAVVGIGTSIFGPPNNSTIMGSVPRSMLGTASASVATSRNVGTALGVAITSAVLVGVASASAGSGAVSADGLPADALLDGIRAGFGVSAGVSSLAIVASALWGRRASAERATSGSAAVMSSPRRKAAP